MRNIDWSMYLRLRNNRVLKRIGPLVLDNERKSRFSDLPENVLVHDLSKGLPFDDRSVDVVYHSHVLEHLDREAAAFLLQESFRVLRPGGIHRVVVPDLEHLCKEYIENLDAVRAGIVDAQSHDSFVAAIIEQMVRKEAFSSRQQGRARRKLEGLLLGDARRRGETHRWMYDSINLSVLLASSGFVGVKRESFDSSSVAGWSRYGLDINDAGSEYKQHSLYMEALKEC